MRVLFSSTRGAGHFQPLLPYARALQERGHAVIVAAPASVEEPLRQAGLAHARFDHPGDEALAPIWASFRDLSPDESTALAVREIFAGLNPRVALPKLEQAIGSFRPDLIVRDSVEFAALIAAESAGVPHARIAVHLVSFEDRIPAIVAEPLAALREKAGLPPDQGASLLSEPTFSAFPESLDEAPAGGGPRTPAPFRARMPDDEPELAHAPWAAGADSRPLVYITFGTIVGSTPRLSAIYRLALEAVAELPVRAVLTTGRGFDLGILGTAPANVQVEEWIPQREVLAHASVVLCHGGSGTVRGALAAGIPLLVVPLGADQPFNAQRIAARGAGLTVSNPDAETLRAALLRVLEDPSLRAGAKRLADEVAALPSVDAAIDAMVTMAGSARPPAQRA